MSLMLLFPILQARDRMGTVREYADKKANTQGRFEPRAAYLSSFSVELPLSPSARAAPPLGPSWFQARLPAREKAVSMGADTKANTQGGGALERGHGASLERLAELGDALGGVGAASMLNAAQHVVGQAVSIQKRRVNGH